MPHISLNDIERERDPVYSSDFLLQMEIPGEIRDIVEGATKIFGARTLGVLCDSVSVPSMQISVQEVKLFGHTVNFKGRKEAPEQLSISWFETAGMPVYKSMYGWFQYVDKVETGDSGGLKYSRNGSKSYTTDIFVIPLNTKGDKMGQFVFHNAWINSIDNINFSGQSTELIQINASFTYDYYEFKNIPLAQRVVERALGFINNPIFDRIDNFL